MDFINDKTISCVILGLYAFNVVWKACGGHWGFAAYWLCAFGITISAEFLIPRFP